VADIGSIAGWNGRSRDDEMAVLYRERIEAQRARRPTSRQAGKARVDIDLLLSGQRITSYSTPGVVRFPGQMRILAGGKRVEIIAKGLNQARWRRNDIDVGGREVLNLRIFERYLLAVAERKNDICANLLHRRRDIG